MTSKSLREQSLSELNQQRSKLKSILIAFAIIWGLLLLLNIYIIAFKDTNFALVAVSMLTIPTLLPLLAALNKVNAEIKLRKSGI